MTQKDDAERGEQITVSGEAGPRAVHECKESKQKDHLSKELF